MQRYHPDYLVQCLELARLEFPEKPEPATFDARVILKCSMASFCEALVELMPS